MDGNILLVWDRMGDYHRARWEGVKKVFEDRTVFAADLGLRDNLYGWDNTKDQANYFLLSEKTPDKFDWKRIFRFIKILSSKKIAAVCVAGYGRPEYLFFLLYARLSGRRVILFAESWYPSGKFLDVIKSYYLKFSCDGFLVSGTRAFKHFTDRLTVLPSKVRIGYSVVDNEHFAIPSDSSVRKKRLLCVARFSHEKNLILLIEAFKKSGISNQGWMLTIVGGGPQKEELDRRIRDADIELMEWQTYNNLPALYYHASAFVLPSLFEPWGLVVNEAMAASLPIILSAEVGCLPDLLNPENGWSFQPTDEMSLISILKTIALMSNSDLSQVGVKSKQRIDYFSVSLFANNLKSLIITDYVS